MFTEQSESAWVKIRSAPSGAVLAVVAASGITPGSTTGEIEVLLVPAVDMGGLAMVTGAARLRASLSSVFLPTTRHIGQKNAWRNGSS